MGPLSLSSSSLDRELGLLADRQTRLVLRYLVHEPTDTASIGEIVAHIVHTAAVDETVSRKSVRIGLYHEILPRLERHGLIEYDWRTEEVRYRAHDRTETLLGYLPDG